MKAIQIASPSVMEIVEIEKPCVKAGEVLVKLCYVGFCGSDLNTYLGRNPMVKLPVIPGHEVGAIIEAVGEGVAEELEVGMSVTLNPYTNCGKCESCLSFAEGRSYCIHELDAASNNGVEDIKTLMEQVRIPPQVGRYSVYIIDEVHMLSQAAFNAFLKTLEEPPAHAIFILATTEKHKILPTILSRCQTYDFNRITVENIVRNLRMVASNEGITIDDESLHVIAHKADGAMRDALTIFDQTVAFCGLCRRSVFCERISYDSERQVAVLLCCKCGGDGFCFGISFLDYKSARVKEDSPCRFNGTCGNQFCARLSFKSQHRFPSRNSNCGVYHHLFYL